jgi:putative two-component system response regulator
MEKRRKRIILVDDNATNLTVGKNVLMGMYDVYVASSGALLFKVLEKVIPDLILLDIEMPEMSGYGVIKLLKAGPRTAEIPVIFLTAKSDSGSELEGLSLGAIDYISKPFSPPLLLKRIEVHLLVESQKRELQDYNDNLQEMVRAKTKTVLDLQNVVLKTVADLVEHRDEITGGHVERTRNYVRILMRILDQEKIYRDEVQSWDREFFLQSTLLHDLGKIAIKDSILLKPGKLTAEEYEEMKKHTIFGVRIIEDIIAGMDKNATESSFLYHAKIFAGTHHEKWDGAGYPYGLKGAGIPLQGRLMAIADVYDALIAERPYKKPLSHEEAVKIIVQGRGTHFDPVLTDLFLTVSEEFREISQGANKTQGPCLG